MFKKPELYVRTYVLYVFIYYFLFNKLVLRFEFLKKRGQPVSESTYFFEPRSSSVAYGTYKGYLVDFNKIIINTRGLRVPDL